MTDVPLGTACESVQAYGDSPERIYYPNKGSLPYCSLTQSWIAELH